MDAHELVYTLRAARTSADAGILPALLRRHHAADLAAAMADLSTTETLELLDLLPPEPRAALFGYLEPARQEEVVAGSNRRQLTQLFLAMGADERVDLFHRLSDPQQQAVLPVLAQAEREDLRRLAAYPEGTVGAIMTSDYATLEPTMTVAQAIEHLRKAAPDAETIYQAYVVDSDRRLLGAVSLRQLIVAPAATTVAELMRPDPVCLLADEAQEQVARAIARYDLLALPVVDREQRLVGIVTHDDAIDVAEQEATEDFHKSGGSMALKGMNMQSATIGQLYHRRIIWLLLLVFGNLFSGAGIAAFEATIASNLALVFFLPLLIDSGGNAGSQAATLMVRALATGEVRLRHWSRMFSRELVVAGLMGATMAAVTAALGYWRGGPEIAIVVALTMMVVVVIGSAIGMSLPFVLSHFRLDPATASAPLITSIADASGVVVYFGIATALLVGGTGR